VGCTLTKVVTDAESLGTKQGLEVLNSIEQACKYIYKWTESGLQYPNALGGQFFKHCCSGGIVGTDVDDPAEDALKFRELGGLINALRVGQKVAKRRLMHLNLLSLSANFIIPIG
jgi:hypothetical protein